MRLDAEVASGLFEAGAVGAIACQHEMGFGFGSHHFAGGGQQIVEAFLGNQPAYLGDHQRVGRNVVAAAELISLGEPQSGARNIDAVVDDMEAILGKQVARGEGPVAVAADRDDAGQRAVDDPHGRALPQRRARLHEALGLGTLVRKVDLFHEQQRGHPRIGAEESGEVEVQNARAVLAQHGKQPGGGFGAQAP